MTWQLAGLLAAACSLFSLGFLLCAVVTAPLLREGERVPEHPKPELLGDNAEWCARHLTLVPPPAQFVDAEALGWLEGA